MWLRGLGISGFRTQFKVLGIWSFGLKDVQFRVLGFRVWGNMVLGTYGSRLGSFRLQGSVYGLVFGFLGFGVHVLFEGSGLRGR